MQKGLLLFLCLMVSSFQVRLRAADADASPKSSEKAPDKKSEGPGKDDEKPPKPKDQEVKTQHSITINGQKLNYTAVAGTMLLRDAEQKPTASIFYIAYTKDGVEDLSRRPVTFAFNGGPGSSSVWLHMGLLGPRRVLLKEDGQPYPPPYKLVDNEFSLLDESDLVFIDPVSTGFSRAVKPEDAKKFHGVQGDVRSVADFIRLYVTRNTRWDSPKFIIGESYGTTRAAALSGELRDNQRMNVNGIMLVSTVLNFETLDFARGNDLPYLLYLPSYTAAAWYHKKLSPELEQLPVDQAMDKAEAFATAQYNDALVRGASLSPDQRKAVEGQLAHFTGLPEDYIERANLRVSLSHFAEELLRPDHRVIGRFDARYTGFVRDQLSSRMEYDPTEEAVISVFASTFNNYVRTELNYKTDLAYEVLVSVGPWNWGEEMGYLNVAETLADSLTRNPYLRVHVSSGFYDLATPWLAVRYTFDHLQVDPELLKNITIDTYTSGHMTYLNLPDLKKQKNDLARFIEESSHISKSQ
ncbi:MAG TPA: peptidase S10 [Verrucomicrobiae bacterium]|nr:peptidase S10 [Verrucomicrobiae bacterium]